MTPAYPAVNRRWFLLLVLILVAGVLLYYLRPILTPFVLGALLAYLGDPLTDRLQRLGCGRSLAAIVVFMLLALVMALTLLLTVPLLAYQLDALVRKLPAVYQWVATVALPWVQQQLDLPAQPLPDIKGTLTQHWQSVGKVVAGAGRYITSSGINFLVIMGNLVLTPVVAFYLLRDWDKLLEKLLHQLPEDWQPRVMQIATECDEVVGAFLRGQVLVMLALGGIYALGLWMIGLELAFLIGLVAGLASIVPYLGTAVGIIAASFAALAQFQDWTSLLLVAVVFAIGQMIEGYVLTPRLVGGRIGLHPVAVIFAVLAGGQLAGFIGVVMALPVAAVIMVWLRHVHDYYLDSDLYAGSASASSGESSS